MVIRSLPMISPSYVMQVMKRIIAREFLGLILELRKYFWGGKLWTQSYFVEKLVMK